MLFCLDDLRLLVEKSELWVYKGHKMDSKKVSKLNESLLFYFDISVNSKLSEGLKRPVAYENILIIQFFKSFKSYYLVSKPKE